MRRQARPFVTEYRSGRRGKESSTPQGKANRDARHDGDGHREAVFSFPEGINPASDDGYEAAMKAADALFSRKSGADAPREAEAVFGRPANDSETALLQPEAGHEAKSGGPGGGRVLRAIEEPPADRYAELEAERAPKRRGRKPGSKNKPKVKVLESDLPAAASNGVILQVPAGRIDHPLIGAARQASSETRALPQRGSAAATSGTDGPQNLTASRRTILRQGTKTRDRFPWIRTKLGPGEKWKRRLPKVAW